MSHVDLNVAIHSKIKTKFMFTITLTKQRIKNFPIKVTINIGNYEDIFSVKSIPFGPSSILKSKL